MVIEEAQKDSLIELINFIDDTIQFTIEDCRSDGSMPYLHTLVTPRSDGSFSTTVYRKPTHTHFYIQWDSHHTIEAKYSVVNTLHHRARAVCSNQQVLKEEEEDHLQKVLIENKYPIWALNRVKMKINAPPKQDQNKRDNINTNDASGSKKSYMVLPYVKELSESRKLCAANIGYKYIIKEETPSKAS